MHRWVRVHSIGLMGGLLRRTLVTLALVAPIVFAGSAATRGPASAAPPSATGGCTGLAHRILVPPTTSQLITVIVTDHRATTAALQAWGRKHDGCFARLGQVLSAFVGWNGTSTTKREGDGATPVGTFRLGGRLFEIGSPLPGAERHQPITCGSWWDEDPLSPDYNRFVQLPCGQRPTFGGGSEALWTEQVAYQHLVEIRYNAGPIVAGWGSGIFLHASTGGPTGGCVALPAGVLELVLSWLDPAQRPVIAIGTREDLTTS